MNQRDWIVASVHRDLVGPQGGADELITNRPSDQYLTGILYPPPADIALDAEQRQAEDDERDTGDEADGSPGQAISMQAMRRPTSMGVSFTLQGESPVLIIKGSAARYSCLWEKDGKLVNEPGERQDERWRRVPVPLDRHLPVSQGLQREPGPEGTQWYIRGHQSGDLWHVTVVLANERPPSQPSRRASEEASLFQVSFRVLLEGATFVPRHPKHSGEDDDAATNNLIYRNAIEWAVGHTCSATWPEASRPGERTVSYVEATWLPAQHVRSMNAKGHRFFRDTWSDVADSDVPPFDAGVLAQASPEQLVRLLGTIPDAYRRWLEGEEARAAGLERSGELTAGEAARFRRHLERAGTAADRMSAGVELMRRSEPARRAFQFAQTAMVQQLRWAQEDDAASLHWRPFQLAFQLIVLPGLAEPSLGGNLTEDRQTMDLLWFPTGGGKTEAYLALTAFVLFYRRLRGDSPDEGAGVAVLMRYTLRLLTVQQFERAARMVMACESIRRQWANAGDGELGKTPFAIGLWVGNNATPGSVGDARTSSDAAEKARQLARCPVCNQTTLHWDADAPGPRYVVRCTSASCPFAGTDLPLATIDEEVYRLRPALLIGTVDKFAQIVRNPLTAAFFPPDTPGPDLIIQDELHLISGPLGTLAGVYEAAVDLLCTRNGVPPKVIGSTATIRRAEPHVRSLFNRRVAQFPPPLLDATDSGFAVEDLESPGRLYVGLTSAGRSPKFLLQAICASLLQAGAEVEATDAERDPFWTLVAYFNSLRELGGALVMMRDDVRDSIALYAGLHGREARDVPEEVHELTSRVASKEIPALLDSLKTPCPEQGAAVVLATNMLSVGIDIPRLGLMVVNGQPKSMSEYIQATSRVGRNQIPGLIVTCYNAGRPRDRSHYEAFRTWHQALYREVEATAVTPFAPRARDRALHAPVVALARHRVPGMADSPVLTADTRAALEALVEELLNRIRNVSPDEADDAAAEIQAFLASWESRLPLSHYWHDWRDDSLLISAERAATLRAAYGALRGHAKPTPNSLRDVEPAVSVRLTNRLD